MAGITIDDEAIASLNNFNENDKKYVIYKYDDDKIVIESQGDSDQSYDNFRLAITDSCEPRFGVVRFEYDNKDTGDMQKVVVFVAWSPESGSPKMKMRCAFVKEELYGALTGKKCMLEATDPDEIDSEPVQDLVMRCF